MSNEWRYQQYDHDNKTIKNYYIKNYHPYPKKDGEGILYLAIFIGTIYGLYLFTLFLWEQLILLLQKIQPIYTNHPTTFHIIATISSLTILYGIHRWIKKRKRRW